MSDGPALRAELEVSQKAAEGHKSRAEMLERELGAARRAAAEAKKEASGASGEQRAKDVRLNRALEELERHRAQLAARLAEQRLCALHVVVQRLRRRVGVVRHPPAEAFHHRAPSIGR